MSSKSPAIILKNVGKLFRRQKQRTVKEFLPALLRRQETVKTFWALRHVSLEILPGDTLGVLGPNGSGKSTLLKLIAGVSKPTEGSIEVRGTLAPLIELGAGFHPELTGRENVYLNGIILGMKRSEVEQRFQEIVEFAELWDFIDEPIKHYSSGMYLRLAFSVAIHTHPDILLVDEIFAVGDAKFRRKCMKKWEELKSQGVISIFISHDVELIKKFCNRAAFLQDGSLQVFENVAEAIAQYEKR